MIIWHYLILFVCITGALSNQQYNCSSIWPQIEILVPANLQNSLSPKETVIMAKSRSQEIYKIFFRSLYLFWPLRESNVSIRVIVDGEVYMIYFWKHGFNSLLFLPFIQYYTCGTKHLQGSAKSQRIQAASFISKRLSKSSSGRIPNNWFPSLSILLERVW